MKTLSILLLLPLGIAAQGGIELTMFPSLTLSASSRGWGMGNTGIASSAANQALSYNVAATAFTQNMHQASVYYMPWLPGVSKDTRFMHADYLTSVGSSSAIGFAVNYLNMGTLAIRDENGATLGLYRANEYHLGSSYALQLGGGASLGATLRFFGNSMPAGILPNTYSVTGDLGYYQSCRLMDASKVLSWGAVVSNLGGNPYLPATAGIGIAYCQHLQTNDQFMVAVDAGRLLKDDWKGVRASWGVEYGFDESFFLRGGVSLENRSKGNRKFFSLGAGYKGFVSDQSWGVDIHYLIPFGVAGGASPFEHAYGLTLFIHIGNFQ
jgi:hypothetical protein